MNPDFTHSTTIGDSAKTDPNRLGCSPATRNAVVLDRLQALWSGRDVLFLNCCNGSELDLVGTWARSAVGVAFGASTAAQAHRLLRGSANRFPVKSHSVDVVCVLADAGWLIEDPDCAKEIVRVARSDSHFCFASTSNDVDQTKAVAEQFARHALQVSTFGIEALQGDNEAVPITVVLGGNNTLVPILAQIKGHSRPLQQQVQTKKARTRKSKVAPADQAATAPSLAAENSDFALSSLADENARLLERALAERSRAEAAQAAIEQWRQLNDQLREAAIASQKKVELHAAQAEANIKHWREATEALRHQLESERAQHLSFLEQAQTHRREEERAIHASDAAARLAIADAEHLRARANESESALKDSQAEAEALRHQLEIERAQHLGRLEQVQAQRHEEDLARQAADAATRLAIADAENLCARAIEAESALRQRLAEAESKITREISKIEQNASVVAQGRFDEQRTQLEQRIAELESAVRESAPPRVAGSAVRQIAAQYKSVLGEASGKRWAAWKEARSVTTRGARLTRGTSVRRVLQRFSLGRALVLWSSALTVPQDGPGRLGVLKYASRKSGASDPHPLFSSKYYEQQAPDVVASGALGAIHYLAVGDQEGRPPHPLFDTRWYRETYGALLKAWPLTTLEHYLAVGAKDGLRPHVLFDPYHYVSQCEDIASNGREPLSHYLASGWQENRTPHPLFDNDYYLDRNPDVLRQAVPPLLHYVIAGWREGRDPHPLFSTSYYLSNNPDVDALGMNPLVHYLVQGWREGRKPHPRFDPRWYLDNNPDVAQGGIEPLTHYLTRGAWEARPVAQDFDPAVFVAFHPEQIVAGRTPLEAWARMGFPDMSGGDRPVLETGTKQAGSVLFDQMAQSRLGNEDQYSWLSYLALSTAVSSAERQRIEGLVLKAPKLVEIADGEVMKAAARLSFPKAPKPDVTVLVPVFNQLKLTVECLSSLLATRSKASMEVLVVDDASTDETEAALSALPGLVYIRNEVNLGFLRSVNAAAKHASGKYLVILNNDTQVKSDWLDPLLEALEVDGVGISAPKFVFPNGRLQEAGARLLPDGSAQMIGLFDDPALPRYSYARDVDYASGACLAMRRELFETLRGFDEAFAPAYCEDIDICLRVRETGLRVRYEPTSVVYHHLSKTSDSLPGSFKTRQVSRNQQKLVDRWGDHIAEMNKVRVIAFYLPQFHRIPENDRWWGAGFTEWRNVQKALPNFVGHYQPHRPAELGNYDLACVEVMERQSDLARKYGIEGFCYYYYSFSGRRILEMPLERMLETGRPDLPFCICWANENWTRKWDGGDQAVLLSQRYAQEDDVVIIRDIVRYLKVPSYIRVNGKPFVAIYRPQLLPNAKRTAETWRRICREEGVGEIHLAMVEVFEHARTHPKPSDWGFDSTIEFPPAGMSHPTPHGGAQLNPNFKGVVSDYRRVVQDFIKEPIPGHLRFRGVMPSWDNTPRRQDDSFCFINATPGAFQAWLEAIIAQTKDQNVGEERIVFVNAWNEWAEGAHLEPDERFGRGWLEAVRNAQEPEHLLTNRRNAKAW